MKKLLSDSVFTSLCQFTYKCDAPASKQKQIFWQMWHCKPIKAAQRTVKLLLKKRLRLGVVQTVNAHVSAGTQGINKLPRVKCFESSQTLDFRKMRIWEWWRKPCWVYKQRSMWGNLVAGKLTDNPDRFLRNCQHNSNSHHKLNDITYDQDWNKNTQLLLQNLNISSRENVFQTKKLR